MVSTKEVAVSDGQEIRRTRIVKIGVVNFLVVGSGEKVWDMQEGSEPSLSMSDQDAANLNEAAALLHSTSIPVAFPTETVYGLGADATRSSAVQGIYKAKQRPSDNPLIVHVGSLSQIRQLFASQQNVDTGEDPIPQIYHPLIQRYWPGPLTILLPLPSPCLFAPEVTAGLTTVGIRMPDSPIALALIRAAGGPLAAPSANASTKPSPTTAAHVLHDLDGRIDMILDGGPCTVGVESTVVDGLHVPPLILRPGGVSIEMVRVVPGWEGVQIGYENRGAKEAPRAPGMKYRHYSPKARVILFEGRLESDLVQRSAELGTSVAVLRTSDQEQPLVEEASLQLSNGRLSNGSIDAHISTIKSYQGNLGGNLDVTLWDLKLGPSMAEVAKGLFSALRALDGLSVSVIFVESVSEDLGDEAAAIMNRLRKAAENE